MTPAGPPVPAHTAGTGRPAASRPAGRVRFTNLLGARDLTAERAQWLVDGLVAALPGMRMADLFAHRRDMLDEADLVTVATVSDGVPGEADDEIAGLLASRWDVSAGGDEFLHVTSQFVGERHRDGRVFRSSWAAHFAEVCRLHGGAPALTVLKTCNPVVYCAMRAFAKLPGLDMYPDITGREQDAGLSRQAAAIALVVAPGYGFSRRIGVIHGIGVPEDLYPTPPLSADSRVNAHFASTIGPSDRMLCLLAMSSKAAAERVLRALGAPAVLAVSTEAASTEAASTEAVST